MSQMGSGIAGGAMAGGMVGGPWGAVIGAGVGLAGGLMSGQAEGREARRARDFQRQQQLAQISLGARQRLMATAQMQGGGEATRQLGLLSQAERDYLFNPQYGMSEDSLRAYFDQTPGAEGEMRQLADQFGQRGQEQLARFDQRGQALQGQADQTLAGLQGLYGQNQAGLMSRLASDNSRVSAMGQGLEGMAKEWGRGREAIIDQDASRNLAGLNAQSTARLGATGLGNSTLTSNAMRGNAAEIGRGVQRAKQDLGESQIDRQMGARTTNLGLQDSRSRLGLDILGSTNRDAQNLASTFQGRQLDRNYTMAGQRTGLESDLENRALGLQTAPIQSRLGFIQGPVNNPVGSFNSSQFSNVYSSSGGQGALGQALGGLGGMMVGNYLGGLGQQQGMQQPMTQQGYAQLGPYYPGQGG